MTVGAFQGPYPTPGGFRVPPAPPPLRSVLHPLRTHYPRIGSPAALLPVGCAFPQCHCPAISFASPQHHPTLSGQFRVPLVSPPSPRSVPRPSNAPHPGLTRCRLRLPSCGEAVRSNLREDTGYGQGQEKEAKCLGCCYLPEMQGIALLLLLLLILVEHCLQVLLQMSTESFRI